MNNNLSIRNISKGSDGEIPRLTVCSIGQACLTAGRRYKSIKSICFLLILSWGRLGFSQDVLGKEYWQSLSENEKVSFITGVYSGFTESLDIMGHEAKRQQKKDKYWTSPFSLEKSAIDIKEYYSPKIGYDYELITKLLDAFYTNPDNDQIELIFALHILILHQEGEVRRANELLLHKQKEYLLGK